MSGSGGGSGGGGGGPSAPSGVDCLKLVIRTTLNSPDPKVISKLKKGDELSVEVQGTRGPVVVKDKAGKTAGSITSQQLLDLIKCIDGGYEYVAIVRSKAGGKVEVEVRPKSK